MKKLETIQCTALGTYLADPSPIDPSNLAIFQLEVSSKLDPSQDSDWEQVLKYVNSTNPLTEASLTNDYLRGAIQNKLALRILVENNVMWYRVRCRCSKCNYEEFTEIFKGQFTI